MNRPPRALYISPIGIREKNGMMQRQHQTLAMLSQLYSGSVDVLSLGATPSALRAWLRQIGIRASVLDGVYPLAARLNLTLWYGAGVVLCNKLGWAHHFRFPLRTPLPSKWVERYDVIFCYYPWAYCLLRLDRAGAKAIVDLGDVMADRHERIGKRRWISLHPDDERSILCSASRCIAISNEDAQEFKRLYSAQPPVVPFAPPANSELAALASGPLPARVGYMGAPSFQNEEVLRLLAQPAFLECLSSAGIELVIAGGICDTVDESILEALTEGGARVLGRVESIIEYYAQIAATVNPVGPSTGVKIKALETLMAGRSLITTRWGADPSLVDSFAPQISYVEWPVEPCVIGELTVKVVRGAKRTDSNAAIAYVNRSTEALRSVLTR